MDKPRQHMLAIEQIEQRYKDNKKTRYIKDLPTISFSK